MVSAAGNRAGLRIMKVAQVFNLRYRQFLIGSATFAKARPHLPQRPQAGSLRCSRLETCATMFSLAMFSLAANAQVFQLPTANRALFEKGGEERFFVGTVGKSLTSGT